MRFMRCSTSVSSGAGALFWWAMVYGRYGRRGYGLSVLYVFLTAVHSSVLGALLAVSSQPWYGEYGRQAALRHVSALADQQLAGLLMWVPAGDGLHPARARAVRRVAG